MIHSLVRLLWWLQAKEFGGDEYRLLIRSAMGRSAFRHFTVRHFGVGKIATDGMVGRGEQALTAWKLLSLTRPADPRYRRLHAALKEFTRFQARLEAAYLAVAAFSDNETVLRRLSRGIVRAERFLVEAAGAVEERLSPFGVTEVGELFGRKLAGLLGTMFGHDSATLCEASDLNFEEVERLVDEYKIPLHCDRCGELEAAQPRVAVEGMEEVAAGVVKHWHDLGYHRKAA
jgi:hypothetical protein